MNGKKKTSRRFFNSNCSFNQAQSDKNIVGKSPIYLLLVLAEVTVNMMGLNSKYDLRNMEGQ